METRVLVALEDNYRAYREVLAAGVEALRPGVRVATTVPSRLEEEMSRFDPQVVICDGHAAADGRVTTTWIELSIDPSMPTVVHRGDRRSERRDLSLDALLEIVDEATRLATGKDSNGSG